MKYLLSGNDWVLMGYKPFEPFFNLTQGKKIGLHIQPQFSAMQTSVPGSIHDTLVKNHLIPDPYIDSNSLLCEWVENRDWVYSKSFHHPFIHSKMPIYLILEGINHHAWIFINGQLIGEHQNINDSFRINVTNYLASENTIDIIIGETIKEQGQIGGPDTLKTMTQYFGYGWDFSTRLVGLGIFRDAYLHAYEANLVDIVLRPIIIGEKGKLILEGSIQTDAQLEIELFDLDHLIYHVVMDVSPIVHHVIWVDAVKLWNANGCGDSFLYHLRLKLKIEGDEQDEKMYAIGFKDIRYLSNENSPKHSLPYTVEINGKCVWIKGVSMINIDHMLGRVTYDDYEFYIKKMKEMNVNLVRMWGGSVKESDIFYTLCDQYGILVWQDFFQSQSSAFGKASTHTPFLSKLSQAAINTVKQLRNHVSVIIYCGGNELKDDEMKPLTIDHPNLMMLNQIVKTYHPESLFYPTTPSGPSFSYNVKNMHRHLHHNIHGPWTLHPDHFRYYRDADWLFQAEFGVNALANSKTLNRIMPKNLTRDLVMRTDSFWSLRNKHWWDSSSRDLSYFGSETLNQLEDYVAASQFIQSEGIRYAIERNRARAYACSGNIVWQFNEPWPNVDCTSIIDYDKHEKIAYYGIRESYRNFIISASFDDMTVYDHLSFRVDVSNTSSIEHALISIEVWDTERCLYQQQIEYSQLRDAQVIHDVSIQLDKTTHDLLMIRLYSGHPVDYERIYYFRRSNNAFSKLIKANGKLLKRSDDDSITFYHDHNHPVIHRLSDREHVEFETPWIVVFPGQFKTLKRK